LPRCAEDGGERVATGCLTRALGDRAHLHRRHHRYEMRRRRRSRTCGALSRVRQLFARLISHQPAVLFSQNEPATSTLLSEETSISHHPTEQAAYVRAAGGVV
jgi:hypothetical protein